MNEERKALIDEANGLSLEFQPNIPSDKLKALIDEAKSGTTDPIEDDAPPGPAIKPEFIEKDKSPEDSNKKVKARLTKLQIKRKKVAEARSRAFTTKIVTITNKDNRENDVMTTVYLSFENQHFGLSKNVPLDIPVELEVSLISIAEGTMMTLHKDEIVDGKRTGNKVPVRVKKFAISYSGKQPD